MTVGALADEGAPIQVVEKENGVITTQPVQFGSGLSTGRQIDAVAYRPESGGPFSMARYTLSVHVTKDTDSTSVVRVTPHIEAFDSEATRSWEVCESNGGLEGRLFSAIAARL